MPQKTNEHTPIAQSITGISDVVRHSNTMTLNTAEGAAPDRWRLLGEEQPRLLLLQPRSPRGCARACVPSLVAVVPRRRGQRWGQPPPRLARTRDVDLYGGDACASTFLLAFDSDVEAAAVVGAAPAWAAAAATSAAPIVALSGPVESLRHDATWPRQALAVTPMPHHKAAVSEEIGREEKDLE